MANYRTKRILRVEQFSRRFPLLYKNFLNAKIVAKNPTSEAHKYILHSLTDHEPATDIKLAREAADYWAKFIKAHISFNNVDKIVGEEDKGGYLIAMTLDRLIDRGFFSLGKTTPNPSEETISIRYEVGYASLYMNLNGVYPGDRVVVLDDIVDTGSTIKTMYNLFQKTHATIKDVVVLCDRVDNKGVLNIRRMIGIQVKSAIQLNILQNGYEIVANQKRRKYKCVIVDCWVPE